MSDVRQRWRTFGTLTRRVASPTGWYSTQPRTFDEPRTGALEVFLARGGEIKRIATTPLPPDDRGVPAYPRANKGGGVDMHADGVEPRPRRRSW